MPESKKPAVTPDEFARKVADEHPSPSVIRMRPDLHQAALGLVIAAGRLAGECHKYAYQQSPVDKAAVRRELKSALLHVQMACNDQDIRLMDLMQPDE